VHAASRQIWIADVRFGSKADIGARPRHVRFAPESGHWDWPDITTGIGGLGLLGWRKRKAQAVA
jgi:hypothetical protein